MELCASVLAANHAHIARDMKKVQLQGISKFHFDVCDGYFAPNMIFGPQIINESKIECEGFYDVHLAVIDPLPIVPLFTSSKVDMILLQYESAKNLTSLIQEVKASHKKVGLCLTLETPIEVIRPFLFAISQLNLLAVHPGVGGQNMNKNILTRIELLRGIIEQENSNCIVSVDGGVNKSTIKEIKSAGADIAILGSGIFKGNIEENIATLSEIIA